MKSFLSKKSTQTLWLISVLILLITTILVVGVSSIFWKPYLIVPLVYTVLPSLVFILRSMDIFVRIKLGTLIFGALLYLAALFVWMDPSFVMVIFVWLLRINIAEAVITDFVHKKYLSALSGLVVLISMSAMVFSWDGIAYHIAQPHLLLWAVIYTAWNWNFVLGRFGMPIAIYHVAILTAPWIGVFVLNDFSLWVLMRGFTLNMGGSAQVVFQRCITSYFSYPYTERFGKAFLTTRPQTALTLSILVGGIIILL